MKQTLRLRHYARYTDDFIVLDQDRKILEQLIPPISQFLTDRLALTLHPRKVEIRKFVQGIDFLGYVVLPWHTRVRTRTKRRMFAKLRRRVRERERESKIDVTHTLNIEQSLQSYLGVLSHANAYKLSQSLRNKFWFWMSE